MVAEAVKEEFAFRRRLQVHHKAAASYLSESGWNPSGPKV